MTRRDEHKNCVESIEKWRCPLQSPINGVHNENECLDGATDTRFCGSCIIHNPRLQALCYGTTLESSVGIRSTLLILAAPRHYCCLKLVSCCTFRWATQCREPKQYLDLTTSAIWRFDAYRNPMPRKIACNREHTLKREKRLRPYCGIFRAKGARDAAGTRGPQRLSNDEFPEDPLQRSCSSTNVDVQAPHDAGVVAASRPHIPVGWDEAEVPARRGRGPRAAAL